MCPFMVLNDDGLPDQHHHVGGNGTVERVSDDAAAVLIKCDPAIRTLDIELARDALDLDVSAQGL